MVTITIMIIMIMILLLLTVSQMLFQDLFYCHFSCTHYYEKPMPLYFSHTSVFLKLDDAVEASNALRCTHYDAFRFFHPSAQPLNSISMLTRDFQEENEQPGKYDKFLGKTNINSKPAAVSKTNVFIDGFVI